MGAHTGPTNAKLTLHYGIDVPRGGSWLRAGGAPPHGGGETRPFVEGGLIVFDDSFEHEVNRRG